ncbi:MAG: hypothetical protein ACE5H0_12440 [Bacteroidota bacterium]
MSIKVRLSRVSRMKEPVTAPTTHCSSCFTTYPRRERSVFLAGRSGSGGPWSGPTLRGAVRFALPMCEDCWRDFNVLYRYDPEEYDPGYRPGYVLTSGVLKTGFWALLGLMLVSWFVIEGTAFLYVLIPGLILAPILLIASLMTGRRAYDRGLKAKLQADARARFKDTRISVDGPVFTIVFENEEYGRLFRDANGRLVY